MRIADRIGSFRWQTGGTRYFHIELGSRHRAYLAPARAMLRVTALGLALWVSWSAAQAWLAFHDLQDMQARLDQARENTQMFSLINVHLDPYDTSDALVRLGKRLAQPSAGKKKRR